MATLGTRESLHTRRIQWPPSYALVTSSAGQTSRPDLRCCFPEKPVKSIESPKNGQERVQNTLRGHLLRDPHTRFASSSDHFSDFPCFWPISQESSISRPDALCGFFFNVWSWGRRGFSGALRLRKDLCCPCPQKMQLGKQANRIEVKR